MVAIRIQDFKGVIPGRSDELISGNHSSDAQNVNLREGKLQPFKTTLPVAALAKVGAKKSIYRWGSVSGGDSQGAVIGATQANPVTILSTAHGLTTGQSVFIGGVAGMTEINNKEFTVTITGVNTYTLDGINGTAYGAYSSGGKWVKKNGHFFHWLTDVDVCKGVIADDTIERTYFTGDGPPKMTYSPIAETGGSNYPNNSYELGIPAPSSAVAVAPYDHTGAAGQLTQTNPVSVHSVGHGLSTGNKILITGVGGMLEVNNVEFLITVTGSDDFTLQDLTGADIDGTAYTAYIGPGLWHLRYLGDETESRVYVVTYVSDKGEEGPPSPVSNATDVGIGQRVDLSSIPVSPAGNFNITTKNIYRSATGLLNGTDMLFVASLAIANTTYTDTVSSPSEPIPSIDWIQPPTDMKGIISLPNGITAGFTKNTLCLSEPYLPHAWPSVYRPPTDYDIVAIDNFDNVIVIATRGNPYICYATDPASAVLKEIAIGQACVSKNGMTALGSSGVAYPGPDGLVIIGVNGARVITQNYLTPNQWKALNPESIHAVYYDGKYYGFYDNGTVQAGFIFDPTENGIGYMPISVYAEGAWVDVETDSLYMIIGDEVHRWDDGDSVFSYFFHSKSFRSSSPINPGVGRVVADSYSSMTLKLYADNVLKHTQTVTDGELFMLPDGYLAERFSLRVESSDIVKHIVLAETMDDVMRIAFD